MMAIQMAMAAVVAVDKSKVNPGALGFIVVALLGVATWLLIRSMNRHLRRINIPPEPDDPATGRRPQLPDEPS